MANEYRRENRRQLLSDIGRSAWETPTTILSNLAMMPLAGYRGLLDIATGKGVDQAQQSMQGVMQAGYQPKSQATIGSLEAVGGAMETLDAPLQAVGDYFAGEESQNPLLGTAAYTLGNVLMGAVSPTKLAGSGVMTAAKAARGAGVDKVAEAAKFVGDTRYNVKNLASGQLVTRQQLAGEQPGVIQTRTGYRQSSPSELQAKLFGEDDSVNRLFNRHVGEWYTPGQVLPDSWQPQVQKGLEALGVGTDKAAKLAGQKAPINVPAHLGAMGATAFRRNPINRFLNAQDAHLRDTFGITGNVLRELERLQDVMRHANFLSKSKEKEYTHHLTNDVVRGPEGQVLTPSQVANSAAEQFHSQIAYNASILEKFSPGDPRIKNLLSGLHRYITPRHRKASMQEVSENPQIVADLLQLDFKNAGLRESFDLTDDVLKNHISATIKKDNRLNNDAVHLSNKPFFGKEKILFMMGKPHAPDPKILGGVYKALKSLEEKKKLGQLKDKDGKNIKSWGIDELIEEIPDGLSKQRIRENVVISDGYVSINQGARLTDPLLATVQVRGLWKKDEPDYGFYVFTDQMKQGSGFKPLDFVLDSGSDTNRLYIDIQPMTQSLKFLEEGREASRHGVGVQQHLPTFLKDRERGEYKPTDKSVGEQLMEPALDKFKEQPSQAYINKRRRTRMNPYSYPMAKVGLFHGMLGEER